MELQDPNKPQWKIAADIMAAHLLLVGGTGGIFAFKEYLVNASIISNVGTGSIFLSALALLLGNEYLSHFFLPTLRRTVEEFAALLESILSAFARLLTRKQRLRLPPPPEPPETPEIPHELEDPEDNTDENRE